MQLTLHATRQTHHGASRLAIECEPGPGFVGIRGLWSDEYGMHDHEYTPLRDLDIQTKLVCSHPFCVAEYRYRFNNLCSLLVGRIRW